MTENKTENLYTLEWKSETAGEDGKSGNYTSIALEQKICNLREQYNDLRYSVKSVK